MVYLTEHLDFELERDSGMLLWHERDLTFTMEAKNEREQERNLTVPEILRVSSSHLAYIFHPFGSTLTESVDCRTMAPSMRTSSSCIQASLSIRWKTVTTNDASRTNVLVCPSPSTPQSNTSYRCSLPPGLPTCLSAWMLECLNASSLRSHSSRFRTQPLPLLFGPWFQT